MTDDRHAAAVVAEHLLPGGDHHEAARALDVPADTIARAAEALAAYAAGHALQATDAILACVAPFDTPARMVRARALDLATVWAERHEQAARYEGGPQ